MVCKECKKRVLPEDIGSVLRTNYSGSRVETEVCWRCVDARSDSPSPDASMFYYSALRRQRTPETELQAERRRQIKHEYRAQIKGVII